jgi:AraC-like DNA-binding protein
MNWLEQMNHAIDYMEANLTEDISISDVCQEVNTSLSHFQRIFALITGITMGDYLRFRRLSEAGRELCFPTAKVIDVSFRYQYETPESFSKAFYRFHGFSPSQVSKEIENLKYFSRFSIQYFIQGGYSMANEVMKNFYWSNLQEIQEKQLSEKQKYDLVCNWARKARHYNPVIFDELTEWILDDDEWAKEKLAENQQILMINILGRFKEQDIMLRSFLKQIKTKGLVNPAVFPQLIVLTKNFLDLLKMIKLNKQ